MRVLVDTNVLIRGANPSSPDAKIADEALARLWTAGHDLCIVPQVLYEYWSVATRPVDVNGLGRPIEAVRLDIEKIKDLFSLLRDERGILEPWLQIATANRVRGKQAHDARLVAAMHKHGLTHLLTFNAADFKRSQEIAILDPEIVAKG